MIAAMAEFHPILAKLPEEARGAFERLMNKAVREPSQLRTQIPHYLEVIERAAERDGPPAELGRAIAQDCEALLDAWPTLGADGHKLVRAAVEYFLLCRDGDDDLATPDGLDDDAAVVTAVRAHLEI